MTSVNLEWLGDWVLEDDEPYPCAGCGDEFNGVWAHKISVVGIVIWINLCTACKKTVQLCEEEDGSIPK